MEKKLIELMESFTPVVAYTGVLGNIKQGSYIPAGEFFTALNKLKSDLKKQEKAYDFVHQELEV
jgi:hypothetical protein